MTRVAKEGTDSIGIVKDGDQGIVSLARHLPDLPRDMLDLIAAWDSLKPELEQFAGKTADLMIADVALMAPVPRRTKIFGIGLNYADHVAESGMGRPTDQLSFSKSPTSANDSFDLISLPCVSEQLDYKAQLVIVIGRRCRYADRAAVASAIFGYTVATKAVFGTGSSGNRSSCWATRSTTMLRMAGGL